MQTHKVHINGTMELFFYFENYSKNIQRSNNLYYNRTDLFIENVIFFKNIIFDSVETSCFV